MFYITIILMSAVLWHLKEGKLELNKYLFISFCSITFFTQQCDCLRWTFTNATITHCTFIA